MTDSRGLSDLELITSFKSSLDLKHCAALYTRYSALIYGVCLKYLKNREDAKDASLELFEKLSAALKTQEIKHFKGWLYVTTRNHCLMMLRSRKGKYYEEIKESIMENSFLLHPEEESHLENNIQKLENCIEELIGEQRACVQMFYLQEKCYNDISKNTGYSLNKVKSYIQNGKRNLKICMERK